MAFDKTWSDLRKAINRFLMGGLDAPINNSRRACIDVPTYAHASVYYALFDGAISANGTVWSCAGRSRNFKWISSRQRTLFYPKNTSPQPPLSLINGEALSRKQTVKYLVVHFNSNLTWSTHIDSVFTKCLKISFFIRRLRSMKVHKSLLWRIVSACAIPIILYCSPIIFPGLLNKDFASIKKCIRLLSTSSGVAYTHIC